MVLTSGSRLGPYEIVAPLGVGGMGEVYRARDTRLERTVAIKVLRERLGEEPEFQERFDREARTISQLEHPHICALYDVGRQNGTSYLVMQYLEGETLASRLEDGPLPMDEAITFAIEIADALDKAHRSGVVHRDLKPGNIYLTRSGSKLLDFGLAKTAVAAGVSSYAGLTTAGEPATAQGTILGTFQYMAPEQIEGSQVDARTDIFAFGAVLYEMLTGRRAFQGRSQPSLIGAILRDDPPPVSQIQPLVSPLLEHVVRACLAKDPNDRFQTAHDLLLQLRWIAEGGSAVGAPAVVVSSRKRRERATDLALALMVLLWIATLIPATLYFWRTTDERQIQFSIATPEAPNPLLIRISPDGRYIAFVAQSGSKSVLWLRRLNSTDAQPLAGTENAFAPFWSPDSQYIGFMADLKVKKVNVAGGAPQILCATASFANGTWNNDGVILFSDGSVLRRVSADGGEAAPVTQLDTAQQEVSHRWPNFLPDGRHFTYSVLNLQPEKHAMVIGSLDSPERVRLMNGESMAAYAPPGFLIYQRSGTLMAQPFDASRLRLTGDPVLIAEDVANVPRSGRAAFDVSETGVLVYRTGQATAETSALSWFDRRGTLLGHIGEPGPYRQVSLSPDETRVAVSRLDAKTSTWDIWTLDLSDNILTRLSFDPAHEQNPLWSHDGRSVVYVSQRMAKYDFFQKPVAGTSESILFESPEHPKYLDDLSADGRFLLYHTPMVLYAVPLDGDHQPVVLDRTPFKKGEARFSPEGDWVAYESNESGATELYVASFPRFENRRQLTAHGGISPRWRSNGKELFYLTPDGKLMAVDVKTSPSMAFGVPHVLFQTPFINGCCYDLYAVTRDGQRFLFPVAQHDNALRPITVVLNWTAGLKKP